MNPHKHGEYVQTPSLFIDIFFFKCTFLDVSNDFLLFFLNIQLICSVATFIIHAAFG